jgi:phenylacetate-coenzyme A ligase PaaK-like adenylate-forming protein
MHDLWLREYNGEENVTWPGHSTYFALSSGTTEGASKYIPVTDDQLKALIRASRRQMLAIALSDIPKDFLAKDYLVLGGSTDLNFNGVSYSGDLSGIATVHIPNWFERFSRPGPEITSIRDWEEKVNRIVEEAPKWDIVMITGAPSWMRLLFERIIKRYQLSNIHEIWPNLSIYCWGAVALTPYKQALDAMMGKPGE